MNNIKFFIDTSDSANYQIRSIDYQHMRICPNQYFGELLGLKKGILLQDDK